MNKIVAASSAAVAAAVPTLAPAMPADRPASSDLRLVRAAACMIAADEAIDRLHRTYGDDADGRPEYKELSNERNEHIATLIDERAASLVGLTAKANALRSRRLIADWDQHQQVAVSLADDLAGGPSSALPCQTAICGSSSTKLMDPVFSLIEKHRTAHAAHQNAVREEFGYEKSREEISVLTKSERRKYRRTFKNLQRSTERACDDMFEAAAELVKAAPQTLAGAAAVCNYLEPIFNEGWDSAAFPDYVTVGDEQVAPPGAFARTMARALSAMTGAQVAPEA